MSMKRWLSVILVVFSLLGLATACDPQSQEVSTKPVKTSTTANKIGAEYSLVSPGTLTVGTCPWFPPFTYQGDDGGAAGLDIALTQAIAYQLGLKQDVRQLEDLESSTTSGKVDVIASAYSLEEATDKQKAAFAITDDYYTLDVVMVVKADSPYKTTNELKDKRIGYQWGLLSFWESSDPMLAIAQSSSLAQIESLLRGEIEGALMERRIAEHYLEINNSQLRIVTGNWKSRTLHLAVAKENTALLEALNRCIQNLKADGTMDQLIEEHMQ